MEIRKLKNQLSKYGTLYSFDSEVTGKRDKLFVFNEGSEFIKTSCEGLEGISEFEFRYNPGQFENTVWTRDADDIPNDFFIKGHPYQSLVALAKIEAEMPKSDLYDLVPLKKYFGTSSVIVTENITDPIIGGDPYGLFDFTESGMNPYHGSWISSSQEFKELVEQAGENEDSRGKLREFIVSHPQGGEDWFLNNVISYSGYNRCENGPTKEFREKFGEIRTSEVLIKSQSALEALYTDLEKAGKKLRVSKHIDPRPQNVFFRGYENGRFQFTLIDQYHCGSEELYHHRIKFGRSPTLRL